MRRVGQGPMSSANRVTASPAQLSRGCWLGGLLPGHNNNCEAGTGNEATITANKSENKKERSHFY